MHAFISVLQHFMHLHTFLQLTLWRSSFPRERSEQKSFHKSKLDSIFRAKDCSKPLSQAWTQSGELNIPVEMI